nr:unnamed protein product [Digitaria exilis]
MLPCPLPASENAGAKYGAAMFTGALGGARRLLAGGGAANDYCQKKRSFFKQFYGSVTKEDYTAMRLGFVMKHCKGHPKFNFYKYMIRAFEADFKKVVGISVVSQLLCAYSTLPLYAIVSHMGNSFKKAIFDDNVSEGLVNWAQNARRRKGKKTTSSEAGDSSVDGRYGGSVQMANA